MTDWYDDPARVAEFLRSQPYADVVQTLVEDGSIALSIADLIDRLASPAPVLQEETGSEAALDPCRDEHDDRADHADLDEVETDVLLVGSAAVRHSSNGEVGEDPDGAADQDHGGDSLGHLEREHDHDRVGYSRTRGESSGVSQEETGTRELAIARWIAARVCRERSAALGFTVGDWDQMPEAVRGRWLAEARELLAAASLPSGDGERGWKPQLVTETARLRELLHAVDDVLDEHNVTRVDAGGVELTRAMRVARALASTTSGDAALQRALLERDEARAAAPAPPSGETGGELPATIAGALDQAADELECVVDQSEMLSAHHATHLLEQRTALRSLAEEVRAAPPAGETGDEHPGKVGKCLCAYVGDVVTTRDRACPYHGSRGVELRRRADEHERAGCDAFAALARADAESADAEWEQRQGGGDPCTSITPAPAAGETGDGRELREWTIEGSHSGPAYLRRLAGPPVDRYEEVRVREIPSEGSGES